MVSKQKILIVDDDNNIAELIALYLTKECFETKIVNDGEEALKEFASFRPDLIILDLMLPGTDGFEVCRRVREQKNVPILMVSAKKDDIDKIRGLGLGADDYMTKPFSPSELVARVKAHLAQYERLVGAPSTSGIVNLTRIGRRFPFVISCVIYLYFPAAYPSADCSHFKAVSHSPDGLDVLRI